VPTVALIVLVSVGIALIWMFEVPAFQSADEDVHFDYALSIATTHRLISAKEGRPDIDVHPTVTYLQDATGFHTILYNLNGRVSHDYGTRAYYRRIDASAPTVRSDFIAREKRIPYLLIYYPFGYYALDALFIGAGSFITHGSAIGSLFFARAFSVALLPCSLILIYLILVEMRVGLAQRLAILAIIGTFPLTSWVSAYVQPDNLAVTAVLLSLYVTLRLKRSPGDVGALAALGSSLALLLLTKVHFFLAVAPVVIASALVCAGPRRRSFAYWSAFATFVGAPIILAYGAERLVSGGPIGSSTGT
jgi:4-amino-4-deoxy-L-arabinose transferase-like glycosyltransferase